MQKFVPLLINFFLILLADFNYLPPPAVKAYTNQNVTFNLSQSRSIPKNLHGISNNWFKSFPINHNLMIEAITKLDFSQVRFPGGTVGNYYNWSNSTPNWDKINSLPGVPGFVKGSRSSFENQVINLTPLLFSQTLAPLGKDIIYDLGIYTNTNAEIISALQNLKNQGITVKYLELGNEFYFRETYPDISVQNYLNRAEYISAEAKQIFPNVKICLVINWKYWRTNYAWDIPNQDWYDAVVIHAYTYPNNMSQSQFVSWITSQRSQEFSDFVTRIKNDYPGKELWLTEWNLTENLPNPKYTNTFAHSYYVYDFLLETLRHPIITIANLHALNNVIEPKTSYQNQYFNSPPKGVPNNTYSFDQFFVKLAPYWPLTWIGKAFSEYSRFAIGTNPQDQVVAVYFYNQGEPAKGSLALINKTANAANLSLTGLNLANQQLAMSILNKPWDQQSLENAELTPSQSNTSANTISLPAYAIAYLTPQLATLSGDLNADGLVNLLDFNLLRTGFGITYNLLDFNLLLTNFGT